MPSKNPEIYVSKISRRTDPEDLRDFFKKCGKIRNVNVKNGYAFIEFDDYKDAEAAVEDMDGKSFEGQKIIVEFAGEKKTRSKGPQSEDVCFNCGESGH
eukprot:CAMPEP_0176451026 /NCGR_PEP_ID=MMETSP0127-20121128/27538_1 /TAXON_ID=938130 /ORGANISM="Platyophrya macrostoma, Strain WH" /LENGTH=98 /DNA_ID=CAMNT_0017838897 /DNA_START=22 /DNA_END=318 /DNA_ORIENTATION=+